MWNTSYKAWCSIKVTVITKLPSQYKDSILIDLEDLIEESEINVKNFQNYFRTQDQIRFLSVWLLSLLAI